MTSRLISEILAECCNWNYKTLALPPLCTDSASYEVAEFMLTELYKGLQSRSSMLRVKHVFNS